MTDADPAELPAVLADLDELGFDVAVDAHPGRSWVRLDQYACDHLVLDAAHRLAAKRFSLATPSAMSGGWLVGDVAAAIAWPAAAALLTHDILIVTGADDVYLPHPDAERRLAARIAAPESPRSGSTEGFSSGIVTTMHPLVEAVHRRTRRGRHALWGTVTDMVAAAFLRVGDHVSRPKDARRLAEAIIDGCDQLPGGANWHDIAWTGGIEAARVRNICCLWYQTPGGQLCLTCPRISEPDRARMLELRSRET